MKLGSLRAIGISQILALLMQKPVSVSWLATPNLSKDRPALALGGGDLQYIGPALTLTSSLGRSRGPYYQRNTRRTPAMGQDGHSSRCTKYWRALLEGGRPNLAQHCYGMYILGGVILSSTSSRCSPTTLLHLLPI